MSDGWDQVRREARRSEVDLGRCIDSLKEYTYNDHHGNDPTTATTTTPASVDPENQRYDQESKLLHQVDASINRFARVLETMQTMAVEGGTRRQTLSRYNDIFHTSKMDFAKLKSHIQREKQKRDLFGAHNASNHKSDDPARDQLLRERRLLAEATQQGEDIMNKAEAAHTGMAEQGRSLLSSSSRMASSVLARFPAIGNLVERVRRRKKRDQIIIAAMIGFLIFFTLWYLGIV